MVQRNFTDADADEVTSKNGPVECLGMTFESDDARRAYFLDKLREKLQDPEFRKIEGFPIGKDEDILALSDPPYYTACPNPFIEDFIRYYGRPYDPDEPYHREPFAVDVSEGKTDPIYTAHSYHTKVPHKAIMPAILHYTEPGDLILDGFSGSGMTGVAAQMCGSPEPEYKSSLEMEWQAAGHEPPKWGARRVVLNDLGPAATFISANYNVPFDVDAFARHASRMLADLRHDIGWMYETLHTDGVTKGRINYTVWSDIFGCPNCAGEVTFLTEALDPQTKGVKDEFPCPHCGTSLAKGRMDRLYETYHDAVLDTSMKRIKRRPVLINYSVGKSKYEKGPDAADLALLEKVEALALSASVPTNEIPFMHMTHQRARMAAFGVTHIHHFYLPRAAQALGRLWEKAAAVEDVRVRNMLLYFVEQAVWGLSVLNRYTPTHFSHVNQYLTGVYYISSQHAEVSPWYILEGKLERLAKAFRTSYASRGNVLLVTTSTTASLGLFDASVDYIFTDPPFGENIYYADLNFLVESWHRVWTNSQPEAIVDKAKHKGLPDYQRLMQRCFEEYCRVLKPGHWMTVVFHNSSNAVWNSIQEAMLAAGFVVADVRTLDKQQGSFRQLTSTAMKQDLVISAYKPNDALESRFKLQSGTEEGTWDFVRAHLRQLPVFVQAKDGKGEVIAERQGYMLFDRMVAFHVQRGVTVPMSASEFYAGLAQRFPERDGMYFLTEQVAEYERKRMTVREVQQLELFVSNEASAIQWLRRQLTNKPQTLQELTPQFMPETMAWQKHEARPELRDLLEESFLSYGGQGPIPPQIVSWLKKSAELREFIEKAGREREDGSLETDDNVLKARAGDRWYVPDPNRAIDLEKLRLKGLLKEFATYSEGKGRLKQFRTEAVRAGFNQAYNQKDYATIVQVASRLPESVVEEDPNLMMYVDIARLRVQE
jgi:hypothetical protein